ncbi:hypothetical protein COCSUDRAFT_60409 [Coccomyxa subellipsoidea C-169]|uniref:Uncharacterized protein n=1 Tax=Coccomyxa subellipsoidea (strain C-169) TaxID=574566 RepID=I0YII9_COCSC|nr:hypothetical protein COCSUDRAFT_60409 [Coccomyxa subellipsoidea C-169]EIE18208.1 hypothetical protein COCSUDRAFT_60409 [Coccomyxa subellipsoidea C-169]|eukprot:XP_005642752.1 hypothetical protein COCSUDRAFT_60409 [Coccomyxa subellipsoidea C-169]
MAEIEGVEQRARPKAEAPAAEIRQSVNAPAPLPQLPPDAWGMIQRHAPDSEDWAAAQEACISICCAPITALHVYLDVPGELPWAARRWADVETLSLCSPHNKMHKETQATLDSSDPNEVQPLTKLTQLEISTGDDSDDDNDVADILKISAAWKRFA